MISVHKNSHATLMGIIETRGKARFARLPLDWAEKIWFCAPACRWMSLSAILCSKRQIFAHCGRRAHIQQITNLGKTILREYLQFILAIQASKQPFRAALCSKKHIHAHCGRANKKRPYTIFLMTRRFQRAKRCTTKYLLLYRCQYLFVMHHVKQTV